MVISGVQPFTLLDFPEKTACIIFTAGCNFRCGYCHNPEFVLPEKIQQIKTSFIDEETIYSFLQKRKGLLDGVVISGGEPTMMGDLPAFIRNIKELGFLVKLDTNGNRPLVLQHLLDEGLLDYVAMDVKTSLVNYADLVGDCVRLEYIAESIQILMQGSVPYEFRSTLIREIHTPEVLTSMAEMITGASQFFLQQFRPGVTLDPQFASFHSFSVEEMNDIAQGIFSAVVGEVVVRG